MLQVTLHSDGRVSVSGTADRIAELLFDAACHSAKMRALFHDDRMAAARGSDEHAQADKMYKFCGTRYDEYMRAHDDATGARK